MGNEIRELYPMQRRIRPCGDLSRDQDDYGRRFGSNTHSGVRIAADDAKAAFRKTTRRANSGAVPAPLARDVRWLGDHNGYRLGCHGPKSCPLLDEQGIEA